jgi:hypothetical protein
MFHLKSLVFVKNVITQTTAETKKIKLCGSQYSVRSWCAAGTKNFPVWYETRRSITVSTRPFHRFLPWARWIQSKFSHPISLLSILLLYSHLLRLSLWFSGFPIEIFQAFLIPSMCTTRPARCISLCLIILNNILRRETFLCSKLHVSQKIHGLGLSTLTDKEWKWIQ